MNKIILLDESTANQIAAGEVIERPSSVVKELAENSIDAEATQITVEIQNGGISFIRVTDNGKGIDGEDLEFAFERHATSKIRQIKDLDDLHTMGFRGEALASIASISHLEVISKTLEAQNGTKIEMEGGRILSVTKAGSPNGTSFTVQNLFYNTPARYKFLKKDSTEAGYVSEIVGRLALANPGISFKFIQNNKVQLHTPGNHDPLSTIYSIFGKDIAKAVLPVNYEDEGFTVTGYIGKPEIARGNRSNQYIFLNDRYIKSPIIAKALEEAYKTILMQKKFPFSVLVVNTSPQNYDVNVHPQKLEVRFANEGSLFSAIYHGVRNALLSGLEIRSFDQPKVGVKNNKEFEPKVKNINMPLPGYNSKVIHDTPLSEVEQTKLFNPDEAKKTEEDEIKNLKVSNKAQEEQQVVYGAPANTLAQDSTQEIKATNETYSSSYAKQAGDHGFLHELLDAEIVGQIFNTYIMLQKNGKLFIIDQHAAHERIRYEMLKDRLSKAESFSQMILDPFIIKLKPVEYEYTMEKCETFRNLGFDVESFGTDTVILRSIPDFYDSSFSRTDFIEILDRWMQIGAKNDRISDEEIYLISCKGALKANRHLSAEEIRELVRSLNAMENPYTCVHGRPVILTMDKKELEKKFKRIV